MKISFSYSSSETVRLYHGTDEESAISIINDGANVELARRAGDDGHLWTTTSSGDAELFAQVNPANGKPVLVQMDVPIDTIQACLQSTPMGAFLDSPTELVGPILITPNFSGVVGFTEHGFSMFNETVLNINFEILG